MRIWEGFVLEVAGCLRGAKESIVLGLRTYGVTPPEQAEMVHLRKFV